MFCLFLFIVWNTQKLLCDGWMTPPRQYSVRSGGAGPDHAGNNPIIYRETHNEQHIKFHTTVSIACTQRQCLTIDMRAGCKKKYFFESGNTQILSASALCVKTQFAMTFFFFFFLRDKEFESNGFQVFEEKNVQSKKKDNSIFTSA